MQLIIITFAFLILVFTQDVKAQLKKIATKNQNNNSFADTSLVDYKTYVKPDWQKIDLSFLNSYYSQNGDKSPVTGGIGTEQLTDFTQKITLSVPISPKLSLNADAGYDYYSSASTDNIDNIVSSDSSSDTRMHGNVGFDYRFDKQKSLGLRLGMSTEYDYNSLNGGITGSYLTKDENTAVHFGFQAFIDQWDIIYPTEIRNSSSLPTNKRQSFNGSIGLNRVINKKLQVSVSSELIYMKGLLSTPFHRVYFQSQNKAKIENLPEQRIKIPIGLRLNAHLSEFLLMRMYYRFYWDDWGIIGNTINMEFPIKVNRFFSIAPFYRLHSQTGSKYFKPFKEHTLDETYYTSDYDLSNLISHSTGATVSYSPANGIARLKLPFKKHPQFMLKSLDLKYCYYKRNTGLNANSVSFGISFQF